MNSIPLAQRADRTGVLTLLLALFLVTLPGTRLLAQPAAPTTPDTLRLLGKELYVATNGSDTNPGTKEAPFATLERARDTIRLLRSGGLLDAGGVTVWLRGGSYYRTNTFLLTSQDSGTKSSPVIYRGYPGEEAVLTGSLPITNFVPVTDPAILSRLQPAARTNVLMADISNLRIANYGSLTNRGALPHPVRSAPMHPWMVELFHENQRMQLARWPNQDKSQEVWAYTVAPVPGQWQESPGDNWFSYREENPGRWALTEGVWVHGGWCYWWADSYEQVINIDPALKKITTDRPGDFGYTANKPYEALNVLEELDLPGEWVLDRARHRVYFWSPPALQSGRVEISVLAADFVSLTDCQQVTLQNLTLQGGRGSGVAMKRSSHNLVAGCTIRNLGNIGVAIGNSLTAADTDQQMLDHDFEGGIGNRIVGCELYGLGEGGIALSGGIRRNLTPSENTALNNYIHHYNTNIRSYRPGVRLDGVGCVFSHNVIHDSPHQGLGFTGNDHVIEYNKIYEVALDTADAGVVYSVGRDWKQRGTILRYNILLPSREHGFYLDDFASGVTMFGNIIKCVMYPVLVGGGRDNVFENNIVIGFSSAGWHVNNRGNTWAKDSIPGLLSAYKEMDCSVPPYSTRYPELAALAQDIARYESDPSTNNFYELALPKGNQILRNIFLKSNPYVYDMDRSRISEVDNLYYWPYETGFEDPNAVNSGNFRLRSDAEALSKGFQQIPFDKIGVYADAYGLVHPSRVPPYPPILPRAPFLGVPLQIPGKIEVEDFDEGPNGDAYFSTELWNNAWGDGRYRPHAKFYIWGSWSSASHFYKMDIPAQHWVEFTVDVAEAGPYTLRLPEALPNAFKLQMNGLDITGAISNVTEVREITLPAGRHILRLIALGGVRLDYLDFTRQ